LREEKNVTAGNRGKEKGFEECGGRKGIFCEIVSCQYN
jgi:hypothetical protein